MNTGLFEFSIIAAIMSIFKEIALLSSHKATGNVIKSAICISSISGIKYDLLSGIYLESNPFKIQISASESRIACNFCLTTLRSTASNNSLSCTFLIRCCLGFTMLNTTFARTQLTFHSSSWITPFLCGHCEW